MLWIEFLNSDFHDQLGRGGDHDRLADADWLRSFLQRQGLPAAPAGASRLAALRELRALLRRFVTAFVAGETPRPADLAALNRSLNGNLRCAVEHRDEGYRVRIEPAARGFDEVLSAIALSFAEFLADGDPRRIRLCENPDCLWVFHDTSRSRTRRWCDDSCGNLMKVRRFREQRKSHG